MMLFHWLLIALAWGPQDVPPTLEGAHSSDQDEARKEMVQLFGRVETRLKEIDALLYDASAGRRRTAGAEVSVIGKLLDETSGRSDKVLEDIDRILEIAEQFGKGQGQSSSSGGSVQEAMQGQSPLDQPSSGQPQGQRESTPQVGDQKGQEPGQNQDKQGQQEQQEQQQQQPQQPAGETPGDPTGESQGKPENRDSDQSPASAQTGRVQVTDTAERWGDLPVHVRDLFRSEGGRDLPPEYRDWIDSYYRRLNRRP